MTIARREQCVCVSVWGEKDRLTATEPMILIDRTVERLSLYIQRELYGQVFTIQMINSSRNYKR